MDIKINNLLSFHPVDYWDFEFQLTTGNRQLLKKICITGGLGPARNICFNLHSTV